MTTRELINILNQLPEEQKNMEVICFNSFGDRVKMGNVSLSDYWKFDSHNNMNEKICLLFSE